MINQYLICPECFSHNAFDEEVDIANKACHNCQYELLPVIPLEGDTKLFNTLIKQPQPVLVDFWGAWSGPSHELAPLFHDYADKYKGHVIFIRINSDEEQLLANHYKIEAFPTLILFQHDKEIQRVTGLINASILDKLLHRYR